MNQFESNIYTLKELDEDDANLIIDKASEAFNLDPAEGLTFTSNIILDIQTGSYGDLTNTLDRLFKATWSYIKSIQIIQNESDYLKANQLLYEATQGFKSVGYYELEELSLGIQVYTQAMVELNNLNIAKSSELLNKVSEYFEHAGKYAKHYELLIDSMKPDAFFVSMLSAIQNYDFDKAKILSEKAYSHAILYGEKYFENESKDSYTHKGVAFYYKAFYGFHKFLYDFHSFNFVNKNILDSINSNISTSIEHLKKGNLKVNSYVQVYNLVQLLQKLVEMLNYLSTKTKELLSSKGVAYKKIPKDLKEAIEDARKYASDLGDKGVQYLKIISQMESQITNLQNFSKPTKKDFGIYSGIISFGIFICLISFLSYVKTNYLNDISTKIIFGISIPLSLIAGFGFGALKFKGFIPFIIGEKDESS